MRLAILLVALVAGGALAVPYGGGLVNTGHSAQYRHDDPAHGTYEFGYDEDHATGGTFRKEKGGPGYQVGSYGLRDADGRMRIVHYIADAHGFRVKISTNEPGVDVKQDPAATSLTSVHHGGSDGHHLVPAPVEVAHHPIAPVAENYHLPPEHSVHHQPEYHQNYQPEQHHHQQQPHYIEQPVHYSQEEVHAPETPIVPVHRISAPVHPIYDHHHNEHHQQQQQHLPELLYTSPSLTFGQRISASAVAALQSKAAAPPLLNPSKVAVVQNHNNYGPALGATLMASVYAGDHRSPEPVLPKSAYVPDESYGPASAAEYSPTAGHYDQSGGNGDYQRSYYD